MKESKSYEIKTIEDISELINEDNFEAFFIDMIRTYEAYLAMRKIENSVKMPSFTWIDDGEHNLTINLNTNK